MALVRRTHGLNEEQTWEIASQLLDLGGPDQLLIPDSDGVRIFPNLRILEWKDVLTFS